MISSLKLLPKRYKESVVCYEGTDVMNLDFETPVSVHAKGTLKYHQENGKEENVSEYSFRSQNKTSISFALRFLRSGIHFLNIGIALYGVCNT